MREQQKIELDAVCFPIACCLAVVLFFYDDLFCFETSKFKNSHGFKGERLDHTFLPRIAHKDSTKLILFQYPITFLCNFTHFKQELFHWQ